MTAEEGVREANALIDNRPVTDYIRAQAKQHINNHFSFARYAADIVNIMAALGLRPYS